MPVKFRENMGKHLSVSCLLKLMYCGLLCGFIVLPLVTILLLVLRIVSNFQQHENFWYVEAQGNQGDFKIIH